MPLRRGQNSRRYPILERLECRRLLSIQPIGTEFLVNSYTSGSQELASVAVDAEGNFIIAWTSLAQDGSGGGVYAQRYNVSGLPLDEEFRVNSYTFAYQEWPAVAMRPEGDFVITWHSYGDGSSYGVYARRYNAAGIPQGDQFRVNTYTTNFQVGPRIAMDADGDFVIAWTSESQDGSGQGVYAQRYNAAGLPEGNEFRVNGETTLGQSAWSVAMTSAGDFVITWTSQGQDGSGSGVYGRRYSASGVAQGDEFRINTHTPNNQGSPAVAMHSSGRFVITWHSVGQDGPGVGVRAQRFSASGAKEGPEFGVNTYTTGQQTLPTVAMDALGDFVITWRSIPQEIQGYGIYAQRYNSVGIPKGGEFRVNTYSTGNQQEPTIAMCGNGNFIIAWHGAGPSDSAGVYAQRYAVVPIVTASSFIFNTQPHRLNFTFDENVSASLGTADLVVQNLTTMQTIPTGDFSISYDLATNTATFSYLGSGGGISGVLPDGGYRATLLAAGVTTPNGNSLPQDHLLDFFFLQGDANRDRRVNLADFNRLAANFGQPDRDFTQGDFSYDTLVNLADFNILAGRFGTVLGPDGAMARDRGQRLSPSQSMTQFSHHPITRVSQPRPWLPATVDDDALQLI